MKHLLLFEAHRNTYENMMKNLKHIQISQKSLTSLKGIGIHAETAITLNCDRNNLTSFEGVENLIKLKEISAYHNKISSLKGIENLVNLEFLSVNSNNLKNLEGIENLKNISKINLSHNLLTNLNGIENLINLQSLYASENKLENVNSLKNLINLRDIDLSNNNLTSFEFGDFSIEAFELGIDAPDITRFKKLKSLHLWKNNFPRDYHIYIENFCRKNRIYMHI